MSLLIKMSAGVCAGLLAGSLGYAFWPRIEPAAVSARPAVEKPVFVVASGPARTAPAVLAATVAQGASAPAADKTSLERLEAASHLNPASPPESSLPQTTAMRSAPKGSEPSEEAARFCAHGLIALADGDVAGARAFLERAAEAGDSRALVVLGDTYDSATLTRLGAVGIRGDAARAHDYYARALAAGVGAARQRIAALDALGN